MPAVSESQQRLMGMVNAYQKGELKNPSAKVKSVAKHIKHDDARDFAKTKHKGLPEKKGEDKSAEEKIANLVVNYNMLVRAGLVQPAAKE